MKPWHSLEGKTIWITGGAGYLGSPITEAADASAGRVICIEVAGRAEELVKEKKLSRTTPISVDASNPRAIVDQIPALVEKHGVPDGLVHLAFASSAGKTFDKLEASDFQRTLDLTLPPTFELCRGVADLMKTRGGGSIVLFASMYGVVAPDPRMYVPPMTPNPIDYGASKAGVLQMMRYLAVQYGPDNVRFNCVTPGPFPSPNVRKNEAFIERLEKKTALLRGGKNHEIVGPTLFLLTDSASFVTGHSLAVDGGWTAW